MRAYIPPPAAVGYLYGLNKKNEMKFKKKSKTERNGEKSRE